jgi:predicted dehydrogenase
LTQHSSTVHPDRPIRVGIIGASTTGWGRMAHLPALATIPGLEVSAVSTTRLDSAKATAEEFGIPEAYDNPDELIASDSVDLVIVAVRVEHHYGLLQKILAAGKPVYSEWPSGSTLDQTRQLRNGFAAAGVYAATGLQARARPEIRYLHDLVRDGYLGRVQASTLVGAAGPWGDVVDPSKAYLQDDTLGGTMMTIPFGHTIDAVCTVLGEFESLAAMTAIQQPLVRVAGTDQTVEKTTPDQLLLSGRLADGTMVSGHYRGGKTAGTTLHWEINGTEGTLVVTAPNGNLQLSPLTLHGATAGAAELEELQVPSSYIHADTALPAPAATIAETLLVVERDLRYGTRLAPTLDDAVTRKQMLAALRHAADTGTLQNLT